MEEKGEQEKDKKTEEDKAKDKGDIPKEDAQDVWDVNVLSTSPPHAKKASQKDYVAIEHIPNIST